MPGIYVGTSEIKNIYVGTTPVKEVYVGTTKVRPSGWTPGANTVLYLPLVSNTNDYSSYSRTPTTSSGTITYGTRDGVTTAIFSTAFVRYTITDTSTQFTVLLWVNPTRTNTWEIASCGGPSSSDADLHYNCGISSNGQWWMTTKFQDIYSGITYSNGWHLLAYSMNNGTYALYVDGTQVKTGSGQNLAMGALDVGARGNVLSQAWSGGIKDVILENKVRTAQEVTDYYNLTKSKYGL